MRQCPLCSRQYEDAAAYCPLDGRVLLLPDPLLGRVVGDKYRIDAFIGGGAQSRVYRATHIHLERAAAVKVIRGDFAAGDEGVERFRREALAVARLKHPNIVTVHDSGIDPDAGAYLVMEFLEGRSLRSAVVRSTRFSVDDTVTVMRQVCAGVSAAHSAGVIHRDLKPDNIFLESRGDGVRSAKILDFGVAKLRRPPGDVGPEDESDPFLSAAMRGAGTPAYMSPEQCLGLALDRRSDVYSLGCVLFELLTGKPPFVSDGAATIYRKHVEEPPATPSSVVANLPTAVDAIVLRALAKTPSDRYASAVDLAAALESVASPQWSAGMGAGASRSEGRSLDGRVLDNLPLRSTTFVGRTREIAALRGALATTRLVTITGPAGCGKTRLAFEVARDLLPDYPEGVWHAPMAALADPAIVPRAVATALGIHDVKGSAATALIDFLQLKQLLLVLDNCEHIVGACAELVDAILHSCPSVRILVTSEEPLGLLGEAAYAIGPLSLPDAQPPVEPEAIVRFEGVRLLCDRSREASPSFELSNENAIYVARIANRLNGIPLAIEIVSARARELSLSTIAATLEDRSRAAGTSTRTAEACRRILGCSIDWSYDLLDDGARSVFDRLSVFAGGFDLEAAESVCSGGDVRRDDVLFLLSSLVEKALVVADERPGNTRYRLPQAIRQFCGERLRASGQAAATRGRHRAHYLCFAERAEPGLRGSEQHVWLNRLEIEHDNLRAALEWSRTDAETSDAFLRLSAALWQFWWLRGHEREGREWLEGALDASSSKFQCARAKALHGAGVLARSRADYTWAIERLVESLALGRLLDDHSRIAAALNQLGVVRQFQGSHDEARRLLEEALVTAREANDSWEAAAALKNLGVVAYLRGDDDHATLLYEESLAISRSLDAAWEMATTLNHLAIVRANQGDFEGAEELLEETLDIFRRLGNRRLIAVALNNLGEIAKNQGAYTRASELLGEALVLSLEAGNKSAIAYGLECFAGLSASQNLSDRAQRLGGAAAVLREHIGAQHLEAEERELVPQSDSRGAIVMPDRASAAWNAGRTLSIERAVREALYRDW